MSTDQVSAPQLARREGREGNRWVNHQPSSEEVAEWFENAVKLHEGMEHKDWVGGVTLIRQSEAESQIAGFRDDGRPVVMEDIPALYFIPYPKVETRVDYFNTLMRNHQEDWFGHIAPIAAPDSGGMTVGYNAMKVTQSDGSVSSLICYTAYARVLERDGLEWEEREDADGIKRLHPTGNVVWEGAPGTKAVPVLNRWGKVDENAPAKAQTGAVGRALGFLGMLVIPGTGVATAEDVQEAQAQGTGTPGAPATQVATAPLNVSQTPAEGDDIVRERVVELISLLQPFPENLALFQAWAKEREFTKLATIGGTDLKAIVAKLERELDRAQRDVPVDADPSDSIDLSGE